MPSRRRRFRYRPKPVIKRPPANMEITAPQVRLVGYNGEQLGVVSIADARLKAEEAGSDLVMVAQKAMPPVVRIMDLGKHVYEQRKKQAKQKAKSKGGEVKGVRISFKIGEHDFNVRIKQADEFLSEGHKVKVEMRLRGREKGRVDLAQKKIWEFVAAIPGQAHVEGGISRAGGSLSAVVIRSRGPAAAAPEEEEASEAEAQA